MKRRLTYEDTYAQLRKFNEHNISICYWRNNLRISDFKYKAGTGYVFEHEGSYCGLQARMHLVLDEHALRSMFRRRKQRGPVRFRGTPDHMGIRIHMNHGAFPAKQSGVEDGMRYTIEFLGTYKNLSFVDDSMEQGQRRSAGNKEWSREPSD